MHYDQKHQMCKSSASNNANNQVTWAKTCRPHEENKIEGEDVERSVKREALEAGEMRRMKRAYKLIEDTSNRMMGMRTSPIFIVRLTCTGFVTADL